MTDRITNKDQWCDPAVLMAGNGNLEWARWATKWLYTDVIDTDAIDSYNLPFTLTNSAPVQLSFETNNRNWLLVSRAAVATNTAGAILGNQLFSVNITVPTVTFLMEDQPVSNTFGSGQWPHVLYFPEEWTQNVKRTVTATNNSGVSASLYLNFKFLQVRTN